MTIPTTPLDATIECPECGAGVEVTVTVNWGGVHTCGTCGALYAEGNRCPCCALGRERRQENVLPRGPLIPGHGKIEVKYCDGWREDASVDYAKGER